MIGDVHGEHDALVRLLTELGYSRRDGAWRHAARSAVFVGDLIDRGPQQVEVVHLVREMQDAGTALVTMGNHEWNAIAWVTERPDRPGTFLRDHDNPDKRSQHERFLAQVGEGSALHQELVDWFATLPLWLDLPGLRAIHACWQTAQLRHATDRLGTGSRVPHEFIVGAHVKGSPDHASVETLLKGLEVELPAPMTFVDKGGKVRHHARIQWWKDPPHTFRNAALVDSEDVRSQLPDVPLPESVVMDDNSDPRPVIFGHYWATGTPRLQSRRAVCVDYSAALGGLLVAYRWSGETELAEANLIGVPGASTTG